MNRTNLVKRYGATPALWMVIVFTTYGVTLAEAQSAGTITGHVVDKSNGEAIIEAGVEVTPGGKRARSDIDGKFTFKLPPGTYEVRIFAPLYKGNRLQNVVVKADEVTNVETALNPEGQAAIEVREVVAEASKAAEATQMIQRKKAAVVSDNVAAETIVKSPDRNAAEVLKRIPAVTIQSNKYVVVRGLGERYSSALLNGSRLPSTDPSKRVVPLDLFPSEFIEALNILKSYTPDLPGDFSGGLVDIRLKDSPEQLRYTLGASTGGNTASTFKSFGSYKGSRLDYFGFGKDYRGGADKVPSLTDRDLPASQQRGFANELRNIWSPESKTAPPNFGVNFSIGNKFGPLGVSLGTVYSTEYKQHLDEFQETFTSDSSGIIELPDKLTFDRSTFTTRLGAVLASSYKIDDDDKLSLRALVDRNSSDEVIDGIGFDRNFKDNQISQTRLQYKEEQLAYGQIQGQHHLSRFDLDWRSALSQTTEDEPDTRYITYLLDPAAGVTRQLFGAGEGPESSTRTSSTLSEHLSDSAVDISIPFKTGLPFTDVWSGLPAKLKVGPAYSLRHRDFSLRRFRYLKKSGTGLDFSDPAEVLLDPRNIGPNFEFEEGTMQSDQFQADQDIAAFYGMVDLPIVPDVLRLVGGVRLEYSYISTSGFDLLNRPIGAHINDLDPLPGINLIYSLRDDMNFRYGYSQSVSRPEFRELTPTRFIVPNGERPVIGNPDLISAGIASHDARWEWFLAPTEILSFGVFYKTMQDPIEQVVISESAGEADSFRNAKDARLIGFEFEARKNLGVLAEHVREFSPGLAGQLSNFTLQTNVAYVDSHVNIPKRSDVPESQTSSRRALQGQADYVINAGVEYNHESWGTTRLLLNALGSKVYTAGANNLPDVVEEPRETLDLVWVGKIAPFDVPLRAKAAVENMLNDPVIQTQGDHLAHRYRTGVRFNFGLTYSY